MHSTNTKRIVFLDWLRGLAAELGAHNVQVLPTYGFTEAKMAWPQCPCEKPEESSGYHVSPDLGILEGFAIGAMHDAFDGLAECGPGNNNRSRYKSNGQYSYSIKHENILLTAKIAYQPFSRISA